MPDGRFLSKSITESGQLASANCSLKAALLFTWSIPYLDAEGRMLAGAMVVKGKILPLREDITTEEIPGLWGELSDRKLVIWYEVDGVEYVAFPKFGHHQRGMRKSREAASRLPSPKTIGANRLPVSTACALPSDSRVTPDQLPEPLRLREVKNFSSGEKSSPRLVMGGALGAPAPEFVEPTDEDRARAAKFRAELERVAHD